MGFRPVLPSTLRLIREGGWEGLKSLRTVHGYVYLRWIREYVYVARKWLLPYIPAALCTWLAERYHNKVLTASQTDAIIRLDRDIPLVDLDRVVPFKEARQLLLSGPPDVAALECACRAAAGNHCSPSQVCLIVGQPFVDFVLEHHPEDARRLTQEEALALLADQRDRGHVHAAWFKDACLQRFYAICNCCPCCCSGLKLIRERGVRMASNSGHVRRLARPGDCRGCATCVAGCPFRALRMSEEGKPSLIWESCMGCGVCVTQCPQSAPELVRDERKGLPLDVSLLPGRMRRRRGRSRRSGGTGAG